MNLARRHAASLVLAALVLLSGCAGDYVARTRALRGAYESGDYDRALGELDAVAKQDSGNDSLLVLLDRGMVLHSAGRWRESLQVLAQADRLASELDAVSVSEEAGALITNERRRAYRGEDFEKLMISVLQALNYAQLGQDEEALVEVRRVNERLRKMIVEEKKPYEQLAIARYIGGVLYEDQREWDSAYIDYANALELAPGLGELAEPLLRLAQRTGRQDEYERLLTRFPGLVHTPLGPDEGQVVVVVEAGRSPEKEPADRRVNSSEFIQVPVYRERSQPARTQVGVESGPPKWAVTVTSLSDVAAVHLDDRMGRMLAKQVAGVGVKAGLAAGAGALARSEAVGALTFLVLNATNQPDLRSWLSLPAEFQVARLRLPAGLHTVRVEAPGLSTSREVEVKAGRVRVVVVRGYH
ncbi:COG3014 family protein [Melittangium boletus]|uniref:Lipoprotein n=1 Tax=Melittangium boletus DSM 14713 TaxID=1294270 RepID=A0A250I9K4_9BACT|nr:hypothetical protein [Melittangium boletus]ATB27893.1 hypothetical protein MEBOL_001338 [Melittangium boletus DSM 14713]